MWAAGSASPIFGRDGRLTGYVGIVMDVSAVVDERHEQAEQRRFVDAILDIAGTLSASSTARVGSSDSTGPASS